MPAGWELIVDDDPIEPPQPAQPDHPTQDEDHDAAPALSDQFEAAEQATSVSKHRAFPQAPTDAAVSDTSEVMALRAQVVSLQTQLAAATALVEVGSAAGSMADVIELNDQRVLQEVGIYRYHHPLENAAAYKDRLAELNAQIGEMVKTRSAVLASDLFTFDGSLAKGRKMTADFSKLMLRAYNAEADNCVRSLRAGNIQTATRRLNSAVAAIEKLGAMMEMRINPDYHQLRLFELELTADYQMKIQEEREKAREERELLREQRRAEAELAGEKERLDKERAHYIAALDTLRAKGDSHAVGDLEGRLVQIEEAIAKNDYRIANIRAGYVYVISNVGAFGPNVVKVGMTRRLEPMDRVRELGDASVPFRFDVHALYFSDDAVTLENELHKALAQRRVNWVNERREFFFATPAEVRDLLATKVGGLLEYADAPEAAEYFQSRSNWPHLDEPTTPAQQEPVG